jgi:hypothetical protein
MDKFAIEVRRLRDAAEDAPHPLKIHADDVVFTRLIRPGTEQTDDYLRVPPASLAFWLVDNWWRLRYECLPPGGRTPEWRLAHELAAIGGGYVWPRLAIWGEGERIGLDCRSDPSGVINPVRYVTDALFFMAGKAFEDAVDQFLRGVVEPTVGYGSDRASLKAQWNTLVAERKDPDVAAWRRLEAQSGYDPDDAPEELMNELASLAKKFGENGVEEAVQANPGSNSADVLKGEIEATKAHAGLKFNFKDMLKAASHVRPRTGLPPWRAAQDAAEQIRDELAIVPGKIGNTRLSELVGWNISNIKYPTLKSDAPYGLRLSGSRNEHKVALRSRSPASRRFEICCAVGDAIWGRGDALGPIAPYSKTARQKFQRAFAQSLLCPFKDLMEYIGTSSPRKDDINAAAVKFHVTEGVIETTLRVHGVIPTERFEDRVEVESANRYLDKAA